VRFARSHWQLDLMQTLRGLRRTVSGETLTRQPRVSLRTIRREAATSPSMDTAIDREAGVRYIRHHTLDSHPVFVSCNPLPFTLYPKPALLVPLLGPHRVSQPPAAARG
jgi:hypothetical protein